MTEDQAAKVLKAANGTTSGYVKVVRVGKAKTSAAHAASRTGELACGTILRPAATITDVSADIMSDTNCRSCRSQLGLDEDQNVQRRLEALFVLAITLGMRPGELRALTWDHIDLEKGVIHIWKSARRGGDTKTPKSRRTLRLPRRAVAALKAHRVRQAAERLAAGELWQDNDLVFCQEDGSQYDRDMLNWRFSKITRRAGIGHWHAHEARHTAVSIMSKNGVPIQDISDTVGHKSTHVTETVYRHVIVPTIRGGATVMDNIFGEQDQDADDASGQTDQADQAANA